MRMYIMCVFLFWASKKSILYKRKDKEGVKTMLIVLIVLGVLAAIIIGVIVALKFNNMDEEVRSLDGEWPLVDAQIVSVQEYTSRSGFKKNKCTIVFEYGYQLTHKTIIDLPTSPIPIPIGGEIVIKVNPEDLSEVVLMERSYMNTPEYEAEMERLGYVRTEYGYELK